MKQCRPGSFSASSAEVSSIRVWVGFGLTKLDFVACLCVCECTCRTLSSFIIRANLLLDWACVPNCLLYRKGVVRTIAQVCFVSAQMLPVRCLLDAGPVSRVVPTQWWHRVRPRWRRQGNSRAALGARSTAMSEFLGEVFVVGKIC